MKWLLGNWDQVLVALGEHIAISLTALVDRLRALARDRHLGGAQ